MSALKPGDRQGLQILVACAFVIAAGCVATSFMQRPTGTGANALGQPTAGHVAILIDQTDSLPPAQQARLSGAVRGLESQGLRANDLVTLWRLGGAAGDLQRRLTLVYPGRTVNWLWGNPARVAARCDSQFSMPVQAELGASAPASAGRSPILESVREIAEQADFADDRHARALVMASDLFENTESLSFYQRVPTFEEFKATRAYGDVRADLRGVAVTVLYLSRPVESPVTALRLRTFWRDYFTACGAAPVRVEKL